MLTPQAAQILEAIAGLGKRVQDLADALQKVELSLARRIPPEQLHETHLSVHLLKQDNLVAKSERGQFDERLKKVEAEQAEQAKRNAGSDVKGAIGGRALAAIVAVITAAITAAVTMLIKG